MNARVIPIIEFADSSVNEFVEGVSGTIYGRTRQHPDEKRRSQVFPHPDMETEETIVKWLEAWPKARFDILGLARPCARLGVDFVIQELSATEEAPSSTSGQGTGKRGPRKRMDSQ